MKARLKIGIIVCYCSIVLLISNLNNELKYNHHIIEFSTLPNCKSVHLIGGCPCGIIHSFRLFLFFIIFQIFCCCCGFGVFAWLELVSVLRDFWTLNIVECGGVCYFSTFTLEIKWKGNQKIKNTINIIGFALPSHRWI